MRKPQTPIVQRKRKARRLGTILVLGLGHPAVQAIVARAIPFGITARATVPVAATVNRAIPIGRTITVLAGAVPGAHPRPVVIRRKPPKRHKGVIQIQGVASPPQAISATVVRAIPFGRTITVNVIDSIIPGNASLHVQRSRPKRRRGKITLVHAPLSTPVAGSAATLNRAIPIGRSIATNVQADARVARAIPIGRSITGASVIAASVNRAIPIGRSISATSGISPPPVGTPTSAIPIDNGVRSVVIADAGARAGIVIDNGRRAGIVNNTT